MTLKQPNMVVLNDNINNINYGKIYSKDSILITIISLFSNFNNFTVNSMCIYCINVDIVYNSMNVCKWCMSGLATENSILLSVLPRLNNIFNQSNISNYIIVSLIIGVNSYC